MSRRARFRELLALLPPGSTIERQSPRARHDTVLLPDGSPLRDDRGMPVTIAWSPGDQRTRRNEAAKIRKALRQRAS
jgi:hypothetical protein